MWSRTNLPSSFVALICFAVSGTVRVVASSFNATAKIEVRNQFPSNKINSVCARAFQNLICLCSVMNAQQQPRHCFRLFPAQRILMQLSPFLFISIVLLPGWGNLPTYLSVCMRTVISLAPVHRELISFIDIPTVS